MTSTNEVINKIIEIGPVIIIPAILFLIGLVTTRKPLKTLKNCVFIFIGMMGLAIMLTLFINFFRPLIETIITNSSKKFEILDIGWTASRQIILNSPITLYTLIAIVGLNIIMLLLRLTRTINIDLWNLWIFLLTSSLIFSVTEIKWLGVLTAIIISAITLVIGDIYAPFIESYYGIKGLSNPQTQTVTWAPISHAINSILNRIPLMKKIHIFYDEIHHKLGIVSEPVVMGFILGFITGIITKYKNFTFNAWPNILFALGMGLQLAVIMILMPRFVNILYRGLSPTVDDIKSFIQRKITKRDLYIGIDAAFFAGHPSVIALSVIIIPLSAYIATILPGNNILPSADLIIIPFILVWAVAPSRGDIFRSFISAMIIIPLTLWITSDMGALITSFFTRNNIEISEAANGVSSFGGGSNWLFWTILQIIKPILNLFSR
ncbi:MAG: hypothetical protein FJW69_04515 [Actinobacteria bacterium]|nr:hypothetical protein [Actinomycetota bacterium]